MRQPPVFVVGMNGSGTTMMLDCLNAHPELYGYPRETLIIPHYIANLARYGDLDDDERFEALWDEFRNLSCFRWLNHGDPPPMPGDWRSRPRTLATIVDATFHFYARNHGKDRWCEKTPMHAQHIAALAGLFPGACFVHMIRDGRACAASFNRRWGYHPERTIYRWRNIIHHAREQAVVSSARYHEVFYERLTEDPEREMRQVCELLDVPFDPAVLTPGRPRVHTGQNERSITRKASNWADRFSPGRVRRLERIAGGTLAGLGYEVPEGAADHDPPCWRRRLWILRDQLRLGWLLVWRSLTTPRDRRWVDFRGRLQAAVRQSRTTRD